MLCPSAHQLEYAAIPAMFFISMVLYGVEEIGVQIEEPLSIIDLESMVEAIVLDVDEASVNRQAIAGGYWHSISGIYFCMTMENNVQPAVVFLQLVVLWARG